MSKTILMLATFGLEIVEVGGTLALHAQAGDAVYAAVLLSRPESRPQVQEAAKMLGVRSVQFLDFAYGEVQPDIPSKMKIVRLFREIRPDILITQEPEHAQYDFDPDRRLAALLYLESIALAGRDWRVEECGGHKPYTIQDIYFMFCETPNCVVDIGTTFRMKMQALQVLSNQLAFTARVLKEREGDQVLRDIVPNYEELKANDVELGRALHHEMEKANAIYHGLAGHSGAGLAEAFRHQGPFKLNTLL